MRYIVTGSSGFIGKHVANFLGDDTIKFTRGKNEFKTADIVIHTAASKINCIENNVTYTKFILDSMIEYDIKKIVYISTIEVYGPSEHIRDEHSPTSSSTIYSATKMAGEELCKAYNNLYGIDVLILRLCNIYGPDMDPNKYIMKCMNNYYIDLHDGIRSYIHVYDLCNIILLLIKETGIFNIVGEKITNSDILSFTNKQHIVTHCNGNAGHEKCYNIESSKVNYVLKHDLKSFVIDNMKRCNACGSINVYQCLHLGNHPLANNYKNSPDDHQKSYPLGVDLCHSCFHLQLLHIVNPDLMFKNYLYVSGTTDTLKTYFEWFVNYTKGQSKTILDIGCNDGTLLDIYSEHGLETYGVDPAVNLVDIRKKCHKVHVGYFDEKYDDIKPDIITALNVFAHNENPFEFLNNCTRICRDDTKIFIQTSQAEMVKNGEFDTIYHEHINFFNIMSMSKLVERSGFKLIDAIKTPIHGTSYVFTLCKTGEQSSNVLVLLDEEYSQGLYELETYTKWSNRVLSFKNKIHALLDGKRVIAYGAAAKGNTLLNFCEIVPEFIIDDNPFKQNTYSPGNSAPIRSISYLKDVPEDEDIIILPLAWNFYEEIKLRVQSVRNNKNDIFINIKNIL